MVTRTVFLILFFLCTVIQTASALDTLAVKDLSNDWTFYRAGEYLPLVDYNSFSGRTIHFELTDAGLLDGYLRINTTRKISLFANDQLLAIIAEDTKILSLKEVRSQVGFPIMFTLYAPALEPRSIRTHVVKIAEGPLSRSGNVPLTFRKEKNSFSDFFTIALVFLLMFTAVLYHYFPRTFSEYFRIRRAFSFRETDENLLKSRPISQENFFFYLFFCLLVALVLLSVAHLGEISPSLSGVVFFQNVGSGIWTWTKLVFIVFSWLVVKFILINNMTWMFHLGSFNNNHFYNYIRINLIMLLVILIITTISYFSFQTVSSGYYQTVFYLLLVFMGLRVLVIYLKLMNAGGFKYLHLFSYLCATELIPYGIILSSGLNQPF